MKRAGARVFRALFAGAIVLLGSGCATKGVNIERVKGSYQFVRQTVVANLPGGIRNVSQNGREFDSGFFPPDVKKFQLDATKDRERSFAHLTILGSSRPYTINVRVYVEERARDGSYGNRELDDRLTDELVLRLRDDLAHRRDDHNIIDDFRAF